MKVKLVVLTGPSGVGKTTIISKLFKYRRPKFTPIQSTTTSFQRRGDIVGEYEYVTDVEFASYREKNAFAWEMPVRQGSLYGGCQYGVRKDCIDDVMISGNIGILMLDPRAVPVLRNYLSYNRWLEHLVSFYIGGVSQDELRNRLLDQGDSDS